MVVFVKLFTNRRVVLCLGDRQGCTGWELKQEIARNQGIPVDDNFFLSHNGHILGDDSHLMLDQCDNWVTCHIKLPGGKGGFGSMLRAIGAQIEKTTNREACRDLSGRRMRDVNDEKKIADWLGQKSEREEEKARLKRERLEKLRSSPRHVFEDSNKYTTQLQENLESVDDALQKGLKSSSSTAVLKRKSDEKSRKKRSKKQKLWLGLDEDLSSDSDEESDAGSSCSSMATSIDMGSEASTSRLTDISSACTSDSEQKETTTTPVTSQKQPTTTATEQKLCSTTVTASSTDASSVTNSSVLHNTPDEDKKDESTIKTDYEIEKKTTPSDVVEKETEVPREKVKEEPALATTETEPFNLDQYNSKEELEALGLDALKSALIAMGLKCGGTLQQRAERLLLVKGIPRDKIDASLLAKPSNKQQKKRK